MSVTLGQVVYSAVKPIFKIYFIIGLGYLLAKKNILTVTTCRDISDTVVSAIMPCLIFDKVVTNLKSSDIKNLGVISFTGTLLFVFGVILAYINYIVTRSPKRWLGGLLSVGLFPNISDLPIAYMQTLSASGKIFTTEEGNLGVAYVCIFLATQVFYQFSMGLYQLIEWDFREELQPKVEDIESKAATERSYSPTSTEPITNLDEGDEDDEDDQTSIESSQSQENVIEKEENSPQRPKPVTTLSVDEENAQHLAFLRKQHTIGRSTSNARSSLSSDSSYHTGGQSIVIPNENALQLTTSRTSDLRRQKSQDINDVINEYSEFEELRLRKSATEAASAIGSTMPIPSNSNIQNDNVSLGSQGKIKRSFGAKLRTNIVPILKNFLAPNSLSLILSISIAMAPPLKALFVHSAFKHIPDAPDEEPPLSFIMDFTGYVGAASVPLGLLLLGATISRLQVKKMPPGFWKTALGVTVSRLIILPIIGVGLTTVFYKGGWYGDDKLVRFVSVLEFGLPSATALVYFTAFYTDPNSDDHLQMDCLAVCLIFQYSALFITLPFLVSFTLKVSLGF
ncbi:protein Ecm3p [[Candida] anglica]|uniref:Protein Ecm3p n=1 Tax=[Candida] anglica TaxID=148631 RepID=A0ABP0EH18_9ASCO